LKDKNPIILSLRAEPSIKKPMTPGRVPILSTNMRTSMTPNRAAFRPTVVTAEQRKRSQRVLLRVGASVHVMLKGKQATLETTTVSVHPHGALVVMKHSLPEDTRLVLEHKHTKERVGCRVARATRELAEGFHVSIEFDSPAPDFWKIAFPPADWHPDGQ
jgi:hypothetical protein